MRPVSPMRLNPWREMAIVMIILMEASWITPWFRSLTPETYAVDSLRVLIILASLVLFSYLLIRGMDYLHLKKSVRQVLMITFLIIGCFIGIKTMLYAHESVSITELISRPIRSFSDLTSLIPAEFIVIIVVLISFWRGLSLAQEHIGPASVMSHFWIGIVMFVAFIFINTIVTGEQPGDFFYLYVFSSLVAMAAARMTVIGMIRGGLENRFNRAWFVGILLSALLVVGISALVSGILADQFPWIGALFLGLLGSIVILMWVILDPIISFLITILGQLTQNMDAMKGLQEGFQKFSGLMNGFSQKILDMLGKSGLVKFILRWGPTIKTIVLVSIIVIVVVGVVLWMAIKLWRDRERQAGGGEEKFGLNSGNFLQGIMDMLRQGWNRTMNTLGQLTDLRQRQRIRAAARIRQVYAELLDLCESLGQPRPEAQTPLEFIPKLERIFPEYPGEVNILTQAYLDVRYGLLPETQKEIADVETAWKKLHAAGRELLLEYKRNKK